jgi:PAS domain S-box-containing protein
LKLTGFTAAELVEKQGFNELIHEDDKERVWADVQEGVDVDAPFELEYRIITRDGSEKWVWEQGRTVTDESGEEFLEGLMIDVTERKALELELSQAQKMEAVGRLAGGIAHDFNNLLAVVTNYADFIADDLPDESPIREDIKEIHSAGVRGADLVRQLLTFSRKALVAPTVLIVDDVVANMMNLLRRSVSEEIEIKTSLDSHHPVLFDRGQLEQVLMNLVVNARDAMSHGGILSISTHSDTRAGANAETEDWVVLTVSDDGEGIAPDAIEHIFEPFFTTKEPGKGTGLGLATVHGIVHKAGGRIDVSSELGGGTTFRIYLPATTASTSDETAVPPPSASSAMINRQILVVEDEEPVRNLVGRILNQAGHEVISASTPTEALEALKNRDVDLVITDVVMPEMSGHALVQELRRRGMTAPVIFMSGYDDEIVADRGVLEGNVLIQKPFTAPALLEAVNERLRA